MSVSVSLRCSMPAGRLGSAEEALALVTTADGTESAGIAAHLVKLNRQRQDLCKKTTEHAVELVETEGFDASDRRAIVLAHEDWNPGLIGICCSRLAEQFGRPVVLMNKDGSSCRGSARSVPGFSVHEALVRCASVMNRDEETLVFGGHHAAAGMTVPQDRFDEFVELFVGVANEGIRSEDLVPAIEFDARADLRELELTLVRRMERMAPFGAGNPHPRLVLEGVSILNPVRMGGGGQHLRARVAADGRSVGAVWWRVPDILEDPGRNQPSGAADRSGGGAANQPLAGSGGRPAGDQGRSRPRRRSVGDRLSRPDPRGAFSENVLLPRHERFRQFRVRREISLVKGGAGGDLHVAGRLAVLGPWDSTACTLDPSGGSLVLELVARVGAVLAFGVLDGREFLDPIGLVDHRSVGKGDRIEDEHLELGGVGGLRLDQLSAVEVDVRDLLAGLVKRHRKAGSFGRDSIDEVDGENVDRDRSGHEFQLALFVDRICKFAGKIRVLDHAGSIVGDAEDPDLLTGISLANHLAPTSRRSFRGSSRAVR